LPHKIIDFLHGELGDQWLGYPEERLELFKFIQQEKITGVHFLSGDIHLGQGLVIKPQKEKSAPPVYSYTSSPLANAFYLVPEDIPSWFSTLFSTAAALLLGFLLTRYLLDVSLIWGLIIGLPVGLLGSWLWRKRQEQRGPQVKTKPGFFEALVYRVLRNFAHQVYLRRLTGVAADRIHGGNVDYVPDNLFPAVNEYNMGIVTVRRTPEDGEMTVQFKLVNPDGEDIGSEQKPHTI
jgi:hypothetical protein